jgi:hypothetical protein
MHIVSRQGKYLIERNAYWIRHHSVDTQRPHLRINLDERHVSNDEELVIVGDILG